jgi:hypothetical protein
LNFSALQSKLVGFAINREIKLVYFALFATRRRITTVLLIAMMGISTN